MPYAVREGRGKKPYKIVDVTTGKTVGSSTTRQRALASIRARYAQEDKKHKSRRLTKYD